MKVLIIGGGGREHALAWKAAQSPLVDDVLVAPGNAGTALEAGVRNVDVSASDSAALLALVEREGVGLTIVGPEQPLVDGIVDRFAQHGHRCFGPDRAGAQLEGSKAFAKEFLARHRIPTAVYASFTETGPALDYLRAHPPPIVVKADGLAAGKGVIVARTEEEAEAAVREMLEAGEFGAAGSTVVIEEFLEGEEASFIAVVDGRRIVPLASSQDHKARDEGDRGPNTGGMGAYSPAPIVDDRMHARIMREIMLPTINGLADEGIEYRGFLYAGLMIDARGRPKVLEFNCRFGDPETQPVLLRMRSDFVELCLSTFDGTLGDMDIDWDPRVTVGVVMASRGYPGRYETGKPISGLDSVDESLAKVFHAGTRREDSRIVTSGGRVLCVVSCGDTVSEARDSAYSAIGQIDWEGAFWRRDIGYRAVARETSGG
jgi:phosphoribosylamine--glycine ligase